MKKNKILRYCVLGLLTLLMLITILGLIAAYHVPIFKKPVIYLYPAEKTEVNVKLIYNGKLTTLYPALPLDGWTVTAYPDGRLINHADQEEYSYLFWEGESKVSFPLDKGFVVKGQDTARFLQQKLKFLGLKPKEYNDFITFWLPEMQGNPYNLITFQGKIYTDNAQLIITPKPDSMLRVFMVYRPLNKPIDIPPQTLTPFERKGFSVIEWGGTRF